MSIESEITRIKNNISTAYSVCGAKGASLPQTRNTANLADTINAIEAQGAEHLSWHQCPEPVRRYLAAVQTDPYDPDDCFYTYINDPVCGAPSSPIPGNMKPVGYTVDNVTFCDNEPNTAIPFSTATKAGTLTALDRLRWYNTTPLAPGSPPQDRPNKPMYARGKNTRDLGGWSCDGGTVRYGMLVRGSEPNPADRSLMVDSVGIKTEVQLLPVAEQDDGYIKKSAWGIDWAGNDTDNDSVYSVNSSPALWKKILSAIFDSVTHDKPVYFHCGVGADRTGMIAIMLEGILGVGRSDIDQDYELTDFALGWSVIGGEVYRSRAYPTYRDLMTAIGDIPLVGGLDDTFRNHCISFALSLGFTADEINAFRAACINGTPDLISVSLPDYAISKTCEHVVFSNPAASVDRFQEYETELIPDDGYVIDEISVTMNGENITDSVFEGEPAAPQGTIQITDRSLTDVAQYANAQLIAPTLVSGNIKKDVEILGVTGTYEGSAAAVNCKIFSYTSAAAVANQNVTIVSGDPDVAAHYSDSDAMVTVRKVTNNSSNGLAILIGSNHAFNSDATTYGTYMNYNGTTNAAGPVSVPLNAADAGTLVCVRATSSGDIIVYCRSTANNFGGADYIITFTW